MIHLKNFKMSLWTLGEKTPWGDMQEKRDSWNLFCKTKFVIAIIHEILMGALRQVTVVERMRSTKL